VVKFVATTHLRVKRDATEATVARYLFHSKKATNFCFVTLLILFM